MSSVVVVVSVVNQPISGREPVALSKSNENHAPAIVIGSCQDFMISVMGVRHSRNPVGRRADRCDRNEGSGADPSHVGEGSEGLLGGGCGRYLCHGADYLIRWATFGHNFLIKSGEVAFFRGELQE